MVVHPDAVLRPFDRERSREVDDTGFRGCGHERCRDRRSRHSSRRCSRSARCHHRGSKDASPKSRSRRTSRRPDDAERLRAAVRPELLSAHDEVPAALFTRVVKRTSGLARPRRGVSVRRPPDPDRPPERLKPSSLSVFDCFIEPTPDGDSRTATFSVSRPSSNAIARHAAAATAVTSTTRPRESRTSAGHYSSSSL